MLLKANLSNLQTFGASIDSDVSDRQIPPIDLALMFV
jgi:hypothetical protein